MASDLIPRPSNPPVDLTIRDFKADRALGRASLYGDLANAAAQKICGLYGKSPASIVKTIPFGSGLIDNSKGVFDDLCEDIAPPPAPPAPQFQGGQCDGAVYEVRVFYNEKFRFNDEIRVRETQATEILYGRIGAVTLYGSQSVVTPVRSDSGARGINIECVLGYPGVAGQRGIYQSDRPGNGFTAPIDILNVQITRLGGQPDNCGNPPPSYPAPTANTDNFDSTTVINISPNVPVTVPVRIVPTFAPSVNIFRPEFNIDVGGINVNISPGGFTFSPNVQIEPNINFPISDPRPNPPAPIQISPPASGTSQPTDLTPVTDKLDELLARDDECCVPEEPKEDDPKYLIKTVSTMAVNSGSVALPDGTYKVTLLMTVIPPNAKSQWGGGEADVYFAGHAWFDNQFSLATRQPIDAEDKQFIPPNKSQQAFVFTYNVGYLGVCTVYYRELRPPQE